MSSLYLVTGANRNTAAESSDEDNSKSDGVVLVMPRRNIFDAFEDDSESDSFDDPMNPGSMWHQFHFNSNPFNDLFTRMQGKRKKNYKEYIYD